MNARSKPLICEDDDAADSIDYGQAKAAERGIDDAPYICLRRIVPISMPFLGNARRTWPWQILYSTSLASLYNPLLKVGMAMRGAVGQGDDNLLKALQHGRKPESPVGLTRPLRHEARPRTPAKLPINASPDPWPNVAAGALLGRAGQGA